MTLVKVVSLALIAVTIVHANPILSTPTRLAARDDPPKPSAYPLGDPCTNEWQYLNFNPDDPTDKAHLEQMHHILCIGEMLALTSYGSGSAERALKPYLRYFGPNEDSDDPDDPDEYKYQEHVKSVLDMISGNGENNVKLGEIVGTFVVDNKDFGVDIPNAPQCGAEGTLAYTLKDTAVDQLEKIHFCDISWTGRLYSAADIDCGSLDAYPSEKMDSFSRIILHEMTHYEAVGEGSSLQDVIQDRQNQDSGNAYGTERTHGLIDVDQDDDPEAAVRNADNYAWMALDAWISRICATDRSGDSWQTFFTQDPPNYSDDSDSDPDN
ncbi:hypothetical protein ACET3X_007658 [Alternaria dauci]|uniref:Lysine-specific metallo-endopeptidase domain-containing protein n=1 Tax=Alternaria dauci TaxID=48095 RepID=A0ABR3UDH3_9PLEO